MLLRLYRISNWLHRARVPLLPRAIHIFNRLVFAATIPHSATIGRAVVLGYQGLGVVIHKRPVIGDRVVVGPGTAIGGRSGFECVPVIIVA
jgi:serine O-acetyltransferase